MILVGMIVYYIYGAVLRCPPSRVNVRDPYCRVSQYVHDSLMVGGVSDRMSVGNDTYGVTWIPSTVGGRRVVRRAGLAVSTQVVYLGWGRGDA